MSHLGDRVAPLIDGELDLDASERAMTHMASCPHCQEAADLERLTKQRLAGLGTPQPMPDFTQRLLALGSATPTPTSTPPVGGYLAGGSSPSYLAGGATSFGAGPFGAGDTSVLPAAAFAPAASGSGSASGASSGRAMALTLPPSPASATPGRGTPALASRSPRGSSRPARSLSRSTRNRIVLAAASAACLVGVGVASGVSAAPSTVKGPVSPLTDSVQNGQRGISSQTATLRLSGTSTKR